MDPQTALRKATITTTTATAGLLDPQQANRFLTVMREQSSFLSTIREERVRGTSGELNKLSVARRIIRRKVENNDDGYRAEPTFPTVAWQSVPIRLPWEITEEVLRHNIQGESLDATIMKEMTRAFSLDLVDLAVNGNTADVSGDAPFLTIDNGLLRYCSLNTSTVIHRVDGGAINAGSITKAHFFAGLNAMPNKYRQDLVWIMSPNRRLEFVEYLTDRATPAGDSALLNSGGTVNGPLAVPIVEEPTFPDDRIILTSKRNLVHVIGWDIRKKTVTGATDWNLAVLDKRGHVFFMERDFIVEEDDALVDIHGLV